MSVDYAATFLTKVWARQPDGAAFLSHKDWTTGDWSEHPVSQTPQPADIPTITDLYFAPCTFSDARRLRKFANPGRWLYADLDQVDPRTLTPIPTLAWTTSPGRFQALWLLDRPVRPRLLESLNQKLTYYVGADKGGWSLTKVLRVPGSQSTKYATPFNVRTLKRSHDPVVYRVEEMVALLKDIDTSPQMTDGAMPIDLKSLPDPDDLFRRKRRRIPLRARHLLKQTPTPTDDRSAKLWELENLLLHEARLTPQEVFVLVRACPLNKYRGQRREVRALWAEIAKATGNGPKTKPREPRARTRNGNVPSGALENTFDFRSFLSYHWPEPTWLIDQMWMSGAFGLFPGEPKSYKTTILLDMAISVATGRPFLGRYKVPSPGTVCYIHEEGRQGHTRDLMLRILAQKDLKLVDHGDPKRPDVIHFADESIPVPIHITSYPGLNLLDEESQERLEEHIRVYHPKLVILETLYLLIGAASENDSAEMLPVLELIAHLSRKYDTAIVLSHHFHKSSDDKRHMNRTSGTNTFLRSFESMLSTERIGDEDDHTIVLRSHHREGLGTHTNLKISWDPEDEIDFKVEEIDEDMMINLRETPQKERWTDLHERQNQWRIDQVTALAREGLTLSQAAERMGKSEKTIQRWCNLADLRLDK